MVEKVNAPKVPRAYQDNAHKSIRDAVSAGNRRVMLVSPTGSGKTFMLSRIAQGAADKGNRIAWFCHRRELVAQSIKTVESFGISCGKEHNVQVVSVQSSLAKEELPDADVVILDECHHFAADEWKRIPESYPKAIIIGATATPERGDGRPLNHLFQTMVVAAQPSQLVADGHLVRCETFRPSRVLRANQVAQAPVDAYLKHADGKLTVVFAPTVSVANEIADTFRAKCISTRVIWGDMSDKARDLALFEFQQRIATVLINVFVLTEGWDCPSTECVILARKFGSAGAFMQSVGRGLRPAPGKDKCILIDLPGVTHIHGDPLEDRTFSLDGESGMSRKSAGPAFCRVCGDLKDGGSKCERCGMDTPDIHLKVTNDPLVKFGRIRRDDDVERSGRLAKWMQESRAKGHKWQSSLYRYKATYGEQAPGEIVSRAIAICDGKKWCEQCKTSKCVMGVGHERS